MLVPIRSACAAPVNIAAAAAAMVRVLLLMMFSPSFDVRQAEPAVSAPGAATVPQT